MTDRSIPQAVFESPEALRAIKAGHEQACRELERKSNHQLEEGDPNHPMYDLHLFGEQHSTFLGRQYRAEA